MLLWYIGITAPREKGIRMMLYLENGGDAEEALKLFSVEMRKNLEERIIA